MPRKTLQERSKSRNRIAPLVKNLIGIESSNDIMIKLLNVLKNGGKVPQVGKFYIFIYNAKTTNLRYDQNPLVAVTNVYSWGFRALNFHWGEVRQYTWDEIADGLYEIYPEEIEDARKLPFGNFKTK